MQTDILNKIVELLSDTTGIDKRKISQNTSLNKDLGMEGDDAFEFIKKFALIFNVDISEFDFERYFIREGFNPVGLIKFIFKRKKMKDLLTLADLEQAVIKRKLK